MFAHILFPLDGSATAEAVLPLGAALAARERCEVTLLHLVEPDAPPVVHGEAHLRGEQDAIAYLDRIRERAFDPALHVHRHVHTESFERVPDGIVEHAIELGADLVATCTHGRAGLRHRLFGGIAERVVRAGVAPVLTVPPEARDARVPFRRMLVPLDRNVAHAAALDVAARLAAAHEASIVLLVVVPTPRTPVERYAGPLLPGASSALLDLDQEDAIDYVNARIDELEAKGLHVDARVDRGDPVHLIRETIAHTACDLVVAGSHGKSGMEAFWSGSVTPRVSARSPVPLLLVPAKL
jgi:nucleotide-binding universal stress UspA family protein